MHADLEQDDPVAVRPPKILGAPEDERWLLHKALYGLRRAPLMFYKFLRNKLEELGLRSLVGEPSIFYKKSLRVLCHVDDPVVTGTEEEVEWLCANLAKDMKFNPDKNLGEAVQRYLGREYRKDCRTRGGTSAIFIKHTSTYITGMAEEMEITTHRAVGTPGSDNIKPTTAEEKRNWDQPLDAEQTTQYRRVVGKLRFMVQERPDTAFEVGLLSRKLSQPDGESQARLKRVVRYLLHTQDAELELRPDPLPEDGEVHLDVFSDSDHAGDLTTRRSTSCCVILLQGSLIYMHSKKQTVVSTSSAEAELYAASGSLAEGLRIKHLLEELELRVSLTLWVDNSAARTMMIKQGLQRAKHIEIKWLWSQEVIAAKRAQLKAVSSRDNLADIGTKRLDKDRLQMLSSRLGLQSDKVPREVCMITSSEQGSSLATMAFTVAVVGFSIGSLLAKCSKKKPAEELEEEELTASAVDSGSAAHAARPATKKLTRSFGTQTLKASLRTTMPRRMHYSDGIAWQIRRKNATSRATQTDL